MPSYGDGVSAPSNNSRAERMYAMLGKVVTFETQNQRLAVLALLSFIALC